MAKIVGLAEVWRCKECETTTRIHVSGEYHHNVDFSSPREAILAGWNILGPKQQECPEHSRVKKLRTRYKRLSKALRISRKVRKKANGRHMRWWRSRLFLRKEEKIHV